MKKSIVNASGSASRASGAHFLPQSFAFCLVLLLSVSFTLAQEPKSDLDKAQAPSSQTRTRTVKEKPAVPAAKPSAQPPKAQSPALTDEERARLRREDPSEEEAALLPYVNNFFATTRLGPEDVISVDVFEQPSYSRANITVPPNGRINYPHIGSIIVAGRTTEELEKEIVAKLAEYIREPVVTVQIAQIHSLKFMVLGDVAQPGIYEMTKRLSVTEALAKAGYVTRYGDLSKVSVLRMQASGQTTPIAINLKEVQRGRVPDIFLAPGDAVLVPGNKFKTVEKISSVLSMSLWARMIVR